MKYIIINNLSIELERKKIKNMYLKILPPEGRIHITAPLRMSEDEIRKFVITKLDWIRKQQDKLAQRHSHQEMNYLTCEEIYVWGEKYCLSVVVNTGRPGIQLEGNQLRLFVKEDSTQLQRKHMVDTWYKEALVRAVPLYIEKWEGIIGVKSNSFSIRDMKTRWGTCNIRTKNICLSLQLAKKPPRCLDYVVLHELVHLLESSHNHVFKGYLDHYMPEWRNIRKEMNGAVIS
ncbi:MAG TPA: SprT family zinc-dependent metalloprotease [Mobilitalea sp.]|nr:SprT family zinc-dependent metalloprotease [Mobilitalea sp.]